MKEFKEIKVDLLPEDSDEVIVLTDDEGKEVEFFEIACVQLDGEFYALIQPVEPLEGIDDDSVLIFKLEELDEENDNFVPVEDEELMQFIFDEYLKAAADEEGCSCGHDCNCEDGDCHCEHNDDDGKTCDGDCDCHQKK